MALKYAIDSILQFIIVLHPGAFQYEVLVKSCLNQ